MSYYIHNIPGRFRIKIPNIKKQPHRARKLEAVLSRKKGIEMAVANELTGSLKMHYDPSRVEPEQLLNVLKKLNLVDENITFRNHTNNYVVTTQLTRACGKAMVNWAFSKTLQSSGLGLLSALI
jgi:hypothetical protein